MKNAIAPTRNENFPEWYQQVIKNGELAEKSPVRGAMVIKPWGYAIWDNIQKILDQHLKDTDHENAYFPLLIPISFLEKEAEHIDGFAKECAVVTHHKLEADGSGKLVPSGRLEEPLIIRPTSETIIGDAFSKWVTSYRDLPILINQWANVMRWEMRTRMFLRTSEFLWQEGHTVHATEEEAIIETKAMIKLYEKFVTESLAIPVIVGEKTAEERFPGAVNTFTIEAMMQDGKALQAGTAHFLGQNFSKSSNISYTNKEGKECYAWTTSWGVSTRLIGGLIMTHSDDDGLVLPPAIASKQVVLIPIYRNEKDRAEVVAYCCSLKEKLNNLSVFDRKLGVFIDNRDIKGGERFWNNVKKGVPVRLEVGMKEVETKSVTISTRNKAPKDKKLMSENTLVESIAVILEEIQSSLYERAAERLHQNIRTAMSIEEFEKYFDGNKQSPFVMCFSNNAIKSKSRDKLLERYKVTARCVPENYQNESSMCIFTGEPTNTRILYSKAY